MVNEEDRYGNVVSTDNSTVVTASLSSGPGTLQGTMTATLVDGIASFDDLEDNTAGTLTLQFSAPSLPAVISDPSVVSPAAASSLIVTRPPSGISAGSAFQLEVDAYDPYNNLATSFAGAVTVNLASGPGTLGGTVTTDAVNGVATFKDLVSTTSGSDAFSATSGTLSAPATTPVTVTPAPPSQLIIQIQPSQTATAGLAFATQPVVEIADPYGNVETSDNTTVVTAYLSSGTGPLKGTVTATANDGVATFSGLFDDTAETITLSFTGGGLTSLASVPVTVAPATPSQLVIAQEPSATATVNLPFATQPVVKEEDQFGNLETGDNSTLLTAMLGTGSGPLSGVTSITLQGGVGAFTNLADTIPEKIKLEFATSALTSFSDQLDHGRPGGGGQAGAPG